MRHRRFLASAAIEGECLTIVCCLNAPAVSASVLLAGVHCGVLLVIAAADTHTNNDLH